MARCHRVGAYHAQPNDAAPAYDHELFVLGMVPMVAFSNAGFSDIDGKLPLTNGPHKLSKRPALVTVYF